MLSKGINSRLMCLMRWEGEIIILIKKNPSESLYHSINLLSE